MIDESPTPGFTFGMRMGCVREDHELSMSAMAKSLGIALSTWSSYENDKSFPGPQTIANFCSIYHVNEEWLNTNCGWIYEEGYKPGDPLGEPVDYEKKLLDQARDIQAKYWTALLGQSNYDRLMKEMEDRTQMTKEELTKIRESLSLTKKELAEKLGVTAMLLGRYESGSCSIPSSIAEKVNALLSDEASSDGENEESLSNDEVQSVVEDDQSEAIEEKTFSSSSNDEIEEKPTPIDDPISLIKSLRKKLTLTALGDLLGVSRTTVSNYESGKRVPGEDVLEKIKELVEKTVTPDDVEIEVAPADEKIDATSVADDEIIEDAPADEKIDATSVADDEKIEAAPTDEKETAPVVDDENTEEAVGEAEAAPPSISDLIKFLRKTYTLSALGKLLGVSGTAVSNYESGKNTPKEKIIKKIEELVEKIKNTISDEATSGDEDKKTVVFVDEEEAAPVDEEKTVSPAEEVKTTPADEEKTAPKKVEIYIQSLMGGSITTEDILSRLPDGVETVYIKPEENAAYWVRGAESGSIYLW